MTDNRNGLPRTVRRIVERASVISDEPAERADFLHTVLCQVGMPRRQTAKRSFERRNGGIALRLQAGALYDGRKLVDQPLPYGTRPRLIMVHLSSEAVRARSREIELGATVTAFMRRLGIGTVGRNYAMLRRQMLALAACRMTIGMLMGEGPRTIHLQPVEQFEAWLRPAGSPTGWTGTLTLTELFYETMLAHAVPLDPRALAALAHSALALDTYTWLAHRLCRIRHPAGVRLSWAILRDQFGQEYRDARDFRREFKATLREALAVYPDARVEAVHGGLVLKSSPPPVPRPLTIVRSPTVTRASKEASCNRPPFAGQR